jgi:transaldolase / glucose-6-phosphate isomerase
MNPLRQLQEHGQSIWLDYIRRHLITSGELKCLVDEDGLSGVTSNPTIFDKAIAGSTDYDDALAKLLAESPHAEARTLFDRLEIEDIQMAADVLRPVYDRTDGADGFVSIEVPAQLAHDTTGSIVEARRLWKAVNRPNLMVKIPAAAEGIPAVEELIAEGININITLMFSLGHYEAVSAAYLRGLRRTRDPHRVSSVASFFVSRVDKVVDKALESIGTPEALALRGKIGIANCKQVYQRFGQIFLGTAFEEFKSRGARLQRVLWASTSTKNPAYPDVMYVEGLIGPNTINTLPPATMNAFRDHGRAQDTLDSGLQEAESDLAHLAHLNIDLHVIGEQLLADGLAAFDESFDKLLASLEEKRRKLHAPQIDRQRLALGPYEKKLQSRVKTWEHDSFSRRFWKKDHTLWSPKPVPEISDRMGWLNLPETMQEEVPKVVSFAEEIKDEGFTHVVLLGMGGSSLTPEVFQRTFGNAPRYPKLIVLDSTHPAAVRATEGRIELARTLFLVSSKSGSTIEPLSFFRYFWQRLEELGQKPTRHFAAITDPGTPLEKLAGERDFRRVFLATPDLGGRYSAVTAFGLVPAALIGVDIKRVLDEAWTMAEACAAAVPVAQNPALCLGAALGELVLAGRDKLTFVASASLQALPSWLEQLVAESTGKQGKGEIPVAGETLAGPSAYGNDRVFAHFSITGEDDAAMEDKLKSLEAAGHPHLCFCLSNKIDVGQEFFRWEVAVAALGSVLGINPFNQPVVELAKQLARDAMAAHGSKRARTKTVNASSSRLQNELAAWLKGARANSYVAIQAYLPPSGELDGQLHVLQDTIRDRMRLATTAGYGPRFLHSTGQLHKGGPNTGLFLQLVDEIGNDLAVPETDHTFGQLIQAQALGDYQALRQRRRKVLRVQLGADAVAGVAQLREVFQQINLPARSMRAA